MTTFDRIQGLTPLWRLQLPAGFQQICHAHHVLTLEQAYDLVCALRVNTWPEVYAGVLSPGELEEASQALAAALPDPMDRAPVLARDSHPLGGVLPPGEREIDSGFTGLTELAEIADGSGGESP